MVEVDDVLAELFPEYECEDIEDELLDVEVEGRPLTDGRLARMSATERQYFFFVELCGWYEDWIKVAK